MIVAKKAEKSATLRRFIFRQNQTLKLQSRTRSPVQDIINAEREVTLNFGST